MKESAVEIRKWRTSNISVRFFNYLRKLKEEALESLVRTQDYKYADKLRGKIELIDDLTYKFQLNNIEEGDFFE